MTSPGQKLAVLLCVAPWLVGCIPQLFMAVQEPTSVQYAGTTPIRIINHTNSPICSVQFARIGDFNIDNWLQGEAPIKTGEVFEFSLLPQSYTVSIQSCDSLVRAAAGEVDLSRPTELQIHEGAEAPEGVAAEGFVRRPLMALKYQPGPVVSAPAVHARPAQGFAPSNSGGASNAPAPKPQSTFFSMTLKNNCRDKVLIFVGDKPKFGSGTRTSIGGNTIRSFSGTAPETFWITDASENGLSSFTVSPGSHRMQILPSCTGFAPN